MNHATCTRVFGFDAGHRVLKHESKCANLHGHRYSAEVTVSASTLDSLGRVIDFGKLKELVGAWIDTNWDHTMILHKDDPMWEIPMEQRHAVFGPKRPYMMMRNPTAENMAEELYRVAADILRPYVLGVTHVRLWETPNCYVDYSPT